MTTNRAYVIGHLAADAKLDILKNKTPCVRFCVVVPRSPEHVGARFMPYAGPDGRLRRDQVPAELKRELNDELQVAGYGPRAALWAEGLSEGTCVAVDGWTEERRFFDKTVDRYRVVHEINAVHVITVDVTGVGQAPANWVNVIGRLVKDPLFEVLQGAIPCLRLRLSVPRSARQVSADTAPFVSPDYQFRRNELPFEVRNRLIDQLSIAVYGQPALLYSRYLRAEAHVAVAGWTEERRYYDREAKRERRLQEIHAVTVVCGPGSDFAAGDAYREQLQADGQLTEATLAEAQMPVPEVIYGD